MRTAPGANAPGAVVWETHGEGVEEIGEKRSLNVIERPPEFETPAVRSYYF